MRPCCIEYVVLSPCFECLNIARRTNNMRSINFFDLENSVDFLRFVYSYQELPAPPLARAEYVKNIASALFRHCTNVGLGASTLRLTKFDLAEPNLRSPEFWKQRGPRGHGAIKWAMSQARNVLITMLLGGLWHGASWNFVVWGGLHGVGLVASRAWQQMQERYRPGFKPHYSPAGSLLTFAFVCFAWIFFRSPDFGVAAAIVGRFGVLALPSLLTWPYAVLLGASLLAAHVLSYRVDFAVVATRINDKVFACGYGATVALILPFVNVAVQPFIYFQF
jgi:hypothetical protein